MKTNVLLLIFICSCFLSCKSQKTFGDNYLTLDKTISLDNVRGRIDHMDINLEQQLLYVAALGNNSLEIIDIKNGKLVHSIKGLDEPQGVGYIPQHQEIVIANGGNGTCSFYKATTYEKVATLNLSSDADDIRYDSAERKIYVGYGNGGIAVINADSHRQVGDIKLDGHPEGFQLDKKLQSLYVNVPDAHLVEVIDLRTLQVKSKWPTGALRANFPMAVDAGRHHVYIGYRHPARLVELDGLSGREISSSEMVEDADDVYYDQSLQEVFISGGGGYINIFKNDSKLKKAANIATRNGARTSLLVPQAGLFILAGRETNGKGAELLVYKTHQ